MLQGLRLRLPPNTTVVDVGGGTGALLASLLHHNPGLRGILFDLSSVVAAARREWGQEPSRAGLVAQGRVQFAAGSFLDDGSVPGGDVYVMRCAHGVHGAALGHTCCCHGAAHRAGC